MLLIVTRVYVCCRWLVLRRAEYTCCAECVCRVFAIVNVIVNVNVLCM